MANFLQRRVPIESQRWCSSERRTGGWVRGAPGWYTLGWRQQHIRWRIADRRADLGEIGQRLAEVREYRHLDTQSVGAWALPPANKILRYEF